MELQNIHLSILYTLLPDYLLNLLRMIGIMSSPIHGHYRCAPSPRTQTTSVKDSEKSRMVENSNKEGGNTNVLLDALQPQPIVAAMYSLFQSALHCTSQTTTNPSMTGIQFNTSNAPSFCYFFIDMQPTYGDKIDYSDYTFDSNYKSIEDSQNISTNPNCSVELSRQRSISEGSDDSFICFEEESDTSSESPIFEHIDFDSSADSSDCKLENQEHMKKVSNTIWCKFIQDLFLLIYIGAVQSQAGSSCNAHLGFCISSGP